MKTTTPFGLRCVRRSLYARAAAFITCSLLSLSASAAAESSLQGDPIATPSGDLVVHPINHATFALGWSGKTIYVDPVGGAKRFEGLPRPDLILITDIHGDHMDAPTLAAVVTPTTKIIAPKAVEEKLTDALRKQTTVLDNGESKALL